MISPRRHYLHPLCYSSAHAIHGVEASRGFSTSQPGSLEDFKKEAQQFVSESKFFNFFRRSDRRVIGSLGMNKHFGIAFVRKQDPRLSLAEHDLLKIEKLDVCWWQNIDQRIHTNVYNHTEETLYHHLTR